jgi:RNA polymerase sigma factor (sigma-70 family)
MTEGISPHDETGANQILGLHAEAVAELSPQRRRAYLLRKVHGFSHKEIASHLGIAVSTVEKLLMAAVAQCEQYVRQRTDLQSRCEVPVRVRRRR